MGLIVSDDLTLLSAADDHTLSWVVFRTDSFDGLRTNTTIKAQGTGSVGTIFQSGAAGKPGGQGWENGAAVDHIRRHLAVWIHSGSLSVDTEANGGVRIRMTSDIGNSATNWSDWTMAGQDTVTGIVANGWQRYFLDAIRPPDFVNGTLVRTGIRQLGGIVLPTGGAPDQSEFYIDALAYGTGITVTGGAATPRGSPEIAADDRTVGRGMFKSAKGAFYVSGRVTIGDVTALTDSTFEDTNKVWVWEAQAVSAAFHKLEFVGGTGVNRATFGVSQGTGVDKDGSGGNTFVAGGAVPFRVEAIDSEITAELFGCAFTNPSAIFDDVIRSFKVEDNSLASFTEDTYDANDPGTNDAPYFPASSASNDAAYFGHDERFSLLKLNTGTAGVGTYTVAWEYSASRPIIGQDETSYDDNPTTEGTFTGGSGYAQLDTITLSDGTVITVDAVTTANGTTVTEFTVGSGATQGTQPGETLTQVSTSGSGTGFTLTPDEDNLGVFVALTDLADGTTNFQTAGLQTVSYAVPDDWKQMTVDGVTLYWIRARRDAGTMTTDPLLTQGFCTLGGGMRLEQANCEVIRGTLTNMDTIRVRNGAKLKRCVITDSVAPAKSAALDLGGADPAVDTVRDLTIQNCNKGLLLKGSGNVTYNLRNITFANNTADIRVDFGVGDTVTINILEGGTSTPTIDNVNGSTVNVVANTQVTFDKMKDNTEVRVYDAGTGAEIAGIENATAGTQDNRNFAWSDAAGNVVDYVIHNLTHETIRVEGFTVPNNDTTIDIQQRLDRNYENPP